MEFNKSNTMAEMQQEDRNLLCSSIVSVLTRKNIYWQDGKFVTIFMAA